jgi:hypothetical protein
MLLTTIPFSGFYCSDHGAELDRVIEYETEYLSELGASDDLCVKIADLIMSETDWQKVHLGYAKLYASAFADYFNKWLAENYRFKIKLEFESLESPQCYNYSTDRIFCTLSENDAKALHHFAIKYHKEALQQAVADRFTSYDGFISSYPNTLEAWPDDVTQWDCNQLGTLLACLWELAKDEQNLHEWELLENERGNGVIDDLIWSNLDDKAVQYIDAMRDTLEKKQA